MYQIRPGRGRDKIGRVGGTGDGEESCSPGLQVVKVQGGRACDYPIEIAGEHFGSFDALSPAKGAAEVVRFLVILAVEEIG